MNKKSKKTTLKKNNTRTPLWQWIATYLYLAGYLIRGVWYAVRYAPVEAYRESSVKGRLKLIFCYFLPVGCVLALIAKTCIGLVLLQTIGTETKAVVIPVITYTKIRSNPKYLYEFKYNGNEYNGNSLIKEEEHQRVGDTINIVFLEFWPSMNRPTYYFK